MSPLFLPAPIAAALLGCAFATGALAADAGVRIVLPQDGATIHDNRGRLEVGVELAPPLDIRAGDHLLLVLDGALAASSGSGSFSLTDVPRGAHTIEVDRCDRSNRILAQSPPVTVYMWRASRLFPGRAGH